jgi:hypothetical protein
MLVDVLVGKLKKDISFALRRGSIAQVTTYALDGYACPARRRGLAPCPQHTSRRAGIARQPPPSSSSSIYEDALTHSTDMTMLIHAYPSPLSPSLMPVDVVAGNKVISFGAPPGHVRASEHCPQRVPAPAELALNELGRAAKRPSRFALRRGTIAQASIALDASRRADAAELALNELGWAAARPPRFALRRGTIARASTALTPPGAPPRLSSPALDVPGWAATRPSRFALRQGTSRRG